MPALDHGLSELTPAGALTGIGSLPIVNPSEAIDFVAAYCPRLPFCPQPTSLDLVDGTLAQIGDVSRDLESTVRRFAEAAHNGAFPQAIALKTQLTGPITLSGLLSVREHGPTSADLLAALAERIAECASWQVENLRTIGLPVLVYVDEPALVLVASSDEPHVRALLGGIFRRIHRSGGRTGIHCCATTAPGWLGSFGAETVSFDASGDLVPTLADAAVFDDERRVISLGLIGVAPPPEAPGLAFSRWLTAASRVADIRTFARRTIVTTRCGLGRSTLREAEAAFRAAATASELVNQVAGESAIQRGIPQNRVYR
jgi:methionine synthase II (cobalamin-independent)